MELFEIEGLYELTDTMKMISQVYPKEVKKFMQSEGNKLKRKTLELAKFNVGEETGNLFKGIKRGKVYKHRETGADSVRVYGGAPANHVHLIEYGHKMLDHNKKLVKNGRSFVNGYHIFKMAADEFESKYDKDCDKFADKIIKDLENR